MLVALPTDFFANQTYMSENAFQPAVAESQYSDALFQQAQQLTKEYLAHLDNYNPQNTSKSFSEWAATWIEDRLREIGLDAVYKHNFYVAPWVRQKKKPTKIFPHLSLISFSSF
jgi:hypothetical protein